MGSDSQQKRTPEQSRTDAKLRYANVHLDELRDADRRGGDFDRAHQESFLFHLLGARDAFLQELNVLHKCGIGIEKVARPRLERELKRKGIRSAALDSLSEIEDDQGSWLARAKEMRNHSMHRNSVPRIYHQGGDNHGDIYLTDTRNGNVIEEDYVLLFEQWTENMRGLIQRLRAQRS